MKLLLLLTLPLLLRSESREGGRQCDASAEGSGGDRTCDADGVSSATVPPPPSLPDDFVDPCQDSNPSCPEWASAGECAANPHYMLGSCARSCGTCWPLPTSFGGGGGEDEGGEAYDGSAASSSLCADDHDECAKWASEGECAVNPICELHTMHRCKLIPRLLFLLLFVLTMPFDLPLLRAVSHAHELQVLLLEVRGRRGGQEERRWRG